MATSTDYFNQLQGMQMPPMQPIKTEDDMYRSLLGRAKNFNPLNTEIARAETQAYNSPTEAYENYNKLNPTSLNQYVMMPNRVGGVGGVGDYVTGDAIVNSMTDRYGRMLGLAGAARNALTTQRATLGDLARSMYQQQQAQREQQRQDYIDRYNQLKDMYSMQMQREVMARAGSGGGGGGGGVRTSTTGGGLNDILNALYNVNTPTGGDQQVGIPEGFELESNGKVLWNKTTGKRFDRYTGQELAPVDLATNIPTKQIVQQQQRMIGPVRQSAQPTAQDQQNLELLKQRMAMLTAGNQRIDSNPPARDGLFYINDQKIF